MARLEKGAMSSSSTSVPPSATPVNQRKLCSMMIGITLLLCWVVAPFVAAGTLRWGAGWLYIIVVAVGLIIHRAYVVLLKNYYARQEPRFEELRQALESSRRTLERERTAPATPAG